MTFWTALLMVIDPDPTKLKRGLPANACVPVQVGTIVWESGGAASERIAVNAVPLTAASPTEAVGFAREAAAPAAGTSKSPAADRNLPTAAEPAGGAGTKPGAPPEPLSPTKTPDATAISANVRFDAPNTMGIAAVRP